MKHESAFPVQSIYIEDQSTNSYGMTLRDYFASKIVVAFLDKKIGELNNDVMRTYADVAYMMADTMMEARK
jgi:hypothetical protein